MGDAHQATGCGLQVLPSAAVATQASQATTTENVAAAGSQQQQSGRRSWKKPALIGLGAAAATAGITGLAIAEEEADHGLHAPEFPWSHSGFFSAYDHASIRRGHQVLSTSMECFDSPLVSTVTLCP